MADTFDLEPFIQSLIETVVWCRHQLDRKEDAVTWPLIGDDSALWNLSDEEIKQHCNRVIAERSDKVRYLAIPDYKDLLPLMQQGRLMIFYYQWTLSDGTPRAVVPNYFDFENYPPWDTWTYHMEADPDENPYFYLIAWVPPQFVDLVNIAIEVSADRSIVWLKDAEIDIPYKDLLKGAHLWI